MYDSEITSSVTPGILNIIEQLRALKLEWWLTPDNKLRARGSNLDPLCELYRRKLRRPIKLEQFMKAGKALGLTDAETTDLVVAADNYTAYEVDDNLRKLLHSFIK